MLKSALETVFTIGVYGYSEDAFFCSITDNNIDLFIDIRARRGMRGSKYKFVNSKYLQAKLREMGIAYAHLLELAPSKAIRGLQQTADDRPLKRIAHFCVEQHPEACHRSLVADALQGQLKADLSHIVQ